MTELRLPVVDGGVPPEVEYVHLPRPGALFEARAVRLRALSDGHAARDWLLALARLCDAQHLATAATLAAAPVRERMVGAPLAGVGFCDDAFGAALGRILGVMSEADLPGRAREAVARLRGAGHDQCIAWAAALRGATGERPEPSLVPFVAAAMQVRASAAAASLSAQAIAPTESDCPVCEAPAVAGVVTGDQKVRYLSCSLCASAWHRVRLQCATCGSPSAVSYYAIDGQAAVGVKAEACGDCRTYVKLFYEEERPSLEPLADDAATIALDLLMGEEGYARGGSNLLVAAS